MIDGDVEEALDLLGVQIHREHAAGAGGDKQVGDEFGGDGHAGLIFAILAGVAVKREDGRDARSAGAPQGIHHDEHFHQMMIGGRRGRLNDVNIFAAHVFLDFDESLAVGKGADGALAELDADRLGDGFGQRRVGRSTENLHNNNAEKKKTTGSGWLSLRWGDFSGGAFGGKEIYRNGRNCKLNHYHCYLAFGRMELETDRLHQGKVLPQIDAKFLWQHIGE